MQKAFEGIGHATAVLGILICAAAGFTRVTGSYYIAGYEALTVFSVGLGFRLTNGYPMHARIEHAARSCVKSTADCDHFWCVALRTSVLYERLLLCRI